MFRITVHEDAQCLTLQLEGRLAGRWVQELEECWQRTAATQQKPLVRVDLAGVTFVDSEGQSCLVGLHHQGVELVAGDCLTKAIVAEIAEACQQDAEHIELEAKSDCDAERKSQSRERT